MISRGRARKNEADSQGNSWEQEFPSFSDSYLYIIPPDHTFRWKNKSGFPLGNSHDEGGITDIAKISLFKNFTQVHEKCTNSFMDPIMDVLKKVKDGGQHPHMSLRNAMVAAGHSEKPFDLVGLVKDTVTKGWKLGQYGLTLWRALQLQWQPDHPSVLWECSMDCFQHPSGPVWRSGWHHVDLCLILHGFYFDKLVLTIAFTCESVGRISTSHWRHGGSACGQLQAKKSLNIHIFVINLFATKIHFASVGPPSRWMDVEWSTRGKLSRYEI